MNTKRLVVDRLRGIDQRYYTKPEAAAIIEEMTWDSYDGWKAAGGFDLVTQDLYDWLSDIPAIKHKNYRITSIHAFSKRSKFNEIIFETSEGQLCRLKIGNIKGLPLPASADPFEFLKDEQGLEYNGKSFTTDPTTGAITNGRKRYVPKINSIGSQSCSFGGRLFMVNGVDEPIVYDGYKVSRAGFSERPAQPKGNVVVRAYHNEYIADGGEDTDYFLGTRIRTHGLGSLKPKGARNINRSFIDGKLCSYQYKVSFVNERGQESELSEASEMITFECADGKRRFVVLNLPIGDPTVVARRLYRTRDLFDDFGNPLGPETGRNFYFLREIQDNETTIFEDGIPDSNVGALTDDLDFGPMPVQSKFIASFKNRIFLAGSPDNVVRYSASGMPEVFPKLNILDVGDKDSGEITGMYASTNNLVIFKEFGIFLVNQKSDGSFEYRTITKDVGCIAPNSIRDVPFTGLVFLSHKGVFVMKGFLEDSNEATQIVNLSTPIKEHIERICSSLAYGSVGCIDRNNKEYLICVPTIGEKNNLLLVWHYEVGAWSIRKNYPMSCAVELRTANSEILFGSNDASQPGIFVINNFYRYKNELGADVELDEQTRKNRKQLPESTKDYPVYEIAPLKLNGAYSGVYVAYVNLYCVAFGDEPIKMNIKINRNESLVLEENKSRAQQHTDNSEKQDLYNKSRFNGATFGYHRPVVIRFDVSHFHKTLATEFSFRVFQDETNEAANRFMIVGYSIDAKFGEQNDIRSLTDVLAPNQR